MELETAVKFELGSACVCEVYDEDTDTSTASNECFGCWSDEVDCFNWIILKPWLESNGWQEDTVLRIDGKGLGWRGVSGYAITPAGSILDKLTLENADFTLRFTLDGQTLSCVRSSHDEFGASFVFEPFDGNDDDYDE